jgi:glycosyltransferase involved in cell wall biosynthesis
MKVLVVSEYYPRAGDPVRGVWAHRQALAARDAGADVEVLVLHRPVPPRSALRSRDLKATRREIVQPGQAELDGLQVEYMRYLSPPRSWSYQRWGAWAAPQLARKLRTRRYDLIHAHYAVPAGDAVARAAPQATCVVSVHGHDVHGPTAGAPPVRKALAHARLVLANSAGTAERCRALGATDIRVIHLGTDVPPDVHPAPSRPTLVTVGYLTLRKRHADVIAAVARLRPSHPDIRYVIVGEGPERERLRAQAKALGIETAVEFHGQLPPSEARKLAQQSSLFVMPSLEEAFGVAYIEAMAGGVPAIGCAGEDGPAEIAAVGPGIELVSREDPASLAATIDRLLNDAELRAQARQTAQESFTWGACGRATVEAYEEALRAYPHD